MRILDRYIASEVLGTLFFGVVAFSSLFIGSELVNLARLVAESGTRVEPALRLLLLKVPQILVWTFPMSVLLATLLSLSRLSAASEVVAMRAGGLSYWHLVRPLLAIGLTVSLVTLALAETVVPLANHESQRVWVEEIQGGKLSTVSHNVVLETYEGGRISRLLYAAEFDSSAQVMTNVSMVEFEGGRPVRQTNAERLVWEGDAWYFHRGLVYDFGRGNPGEWRPVTQISFLTGRRRLEMPARPQDVAALQKRPEDMTMRELARQAQLLQGEPKRARLYLVQYHLRWAIPFSSLVFTFIGAPLGIQPHRRATSVGFGLSIIIIFIYYVVLTLGTALGQSGYLPPLLAGWLQNLLLLGFGIYLTLRSRR